ncbi:adenylate/guanylate cyclase domain-containing protein [Paenimyroides aestuarii]|uniref:Guanylate cyclase domain-containing protein n=1 Tax=Paenimyroides aestuarii TaxID=2968490 RepID=A0ABY5NT25_9FLAO|nr:adenylate/guanylate cyclase domain-containing protein [Paenimyroides aestuarii]UUV21552.1 hypothetical protein NPX36_00400 [Paenimyroides aestuarii]
MKNILWLFVLFVVNTCFAQDSIQTEKIYSLKDLEQEIKISGKWRTQMGNNAVWKNPNFDHSSWDSLPSAFLKNKTPHFKGQMWFRKQIAIDSSLVNVPISLLVYARGDAKVYLNGKYLGGFGKANTPADSLTNLPKIFVFSQPGTQTFAVHYTDALYEKQSAFQQNGFKFSLVSVDKYVEKMEFNNYLWLVITGVGCIFITLGVIHFILFGFYRKFIANLFFGIFNICSGLSNLFGYAPALQNGFEGIQFAEVTNPISVVFSLIGALAISGTVNFLFSKSKLRFIILSICVVIILLLMYFVSFDISFFASILTTFIFLEAIIIVLIAAINKKPGSKIIAIGLICSFGFAMLLGMLVGVVFVTQTMNTISLSILFLLGILSFFSTPFAMSAYLASNFAAVSRKLKQQLKHVQQLSEKTLQQEQERKELLENKMNFLETEVKERTKEIEIQKQEIEKQQSELLAEKQKSEDLLLNILPKDVADELKESGESKIKQFSSVSILFSDFTNLDTVSNQLNSQELLDELNHCFKAFDEITTKHQIEKIKTISYSYMAVSGLPLVNDNHAKMMIEVALEMCHFIKTYQEERKKENKPYFEIKIGINSGEVVAGIVGIKKFAYDIWGDAVNTAARMKAKSENGKINVGHTTYELAKDYFEFTYRGELEIKGKGLAKMYFVETKND